MSELITAIADAQAAIARVKALTTGEQRRLGLHPSNLVEYDVNGHPCRMEMHSAFAASVALMNMLLLHAAHANTSSR